MELLCLNLYCNMIVKLTSSNYSTSALSSVIEIFSISTS